jgi:uncharacterized phiE125 gp8 family phage protein
MTGKKIITAPAVEPVLIADTKEHLRVDSGFTDDDGYITGLIKVAREYVENFCSLQLIDQTWEAYYPGWPFGQIELPFYPVKSVESVEYTDIDGNETTFSDTLYSVDLVSEISRIVLNDGESYPSVTLAKVNPIKITVICGYGAAGSAVPGPICQAIKILVADMYENREQTLVGSIQSEFPAVSRLLSNYRMFRRF